MNRQPTPKVIGAFIIGFALVAGAYVISNFGKPPSTLTTQSINQAQQAAPIRSAIEVLDENNNGIEDWRDEFINTDPIVVGGGNDTSYEPPTTLTGQTGINFLQDIVRQGAGQGGTREQVVESTIGTLKQQTSYSIYDIPDIKMIRNWNEKDVHTYANQLATAIIENNQSDLDNELFILKDILNRRDEDRLGELQDLAEIYRLTRDAIIEIPVPVEFAKEHLDLINTLHARHLDISGMTLSFDDPAYALLRLKRYEDDLLGMVAALENIYLALEPYASLFTATDPAVFFTQFSPANRIRI